MGKYNFDLQTNQSYWGMPDILDTDLEKLEFDKNFGSEKEIYNSILDDEPSYRSLMNFPEEEEDELYVDEQNDDEGDDGQEDQDINNEAFEDRESYRNADVDGVAYFI